MPEMIQTFRASDAVQAVWKMAWNYGKRKAKKLVPKDDYNGVLSLLATELCIENAQRTGATEHDKFPCHPFI